MYTIEDLFVKRDIFAAKLEMIMQEEGITKSGLCKDSGISRPTLDKLLAAEITNLSTFEKHVDKILKSLKISPDNILGNLWNQNSCIHRLKNIMHLSDEKISEATNIPIEKLKEIESGGGATLAELRDIAALCQTSVRGVLGNYYFSLPVSTLSDLVKDREISGFWGHIGILLSSQTKYRWYPITSKVHESIIDSVNQDYVVIPCMNNILLLLNMEAVDDIILLDEACDAPSDCDWNPHVSEGDVPLVVYEALDDYFIEDDEIVGDLMSDKFRKLISEIVKKKGWSENDVWHMTREITVYYQKGNKLVKDIETDYFQNLCDLINEIYDFGDMEIDIKRPFFSTFDQELFIINIENVAMIEMPLITIENEICKRFEEIDEE